MFTKIKNKKEIKKDIQAIQPEQPTRSAIGTESRNNMMKSRSISRRTTAFVACVALSMLLVAIATGPFLLAQDADAMDGDNAYDGTRKFIGTETTDKQYCQDVKEQCLKEDNKEACHQFVKYCT